jgi:hypothetical protein
MLPILPLPGQVFIHVRLGRCAVARLVQVAPYEYEVQRAANWEALEPDACAAVEAQVGAIVEDGMVRCPDDLAAKATWPESDGE